MFDFPFPFPFPFWYILKWSIKYLLCQPSAYVFDCFLIFMCVFSVSQSLLLLFLSAYFVLFWFLDSSPLWRGFFEGFRSWFRAFSALEKWAFLRNEHFCLALGHFADTSFVFCLVWGLLFGCYNNHSQLFGVLMDSDIRKSTKKVTVI